MELDKEALESCVPRQLELVALDMILLFYILINFSFFETKLFEIKKSEIFLSSRNTVKSAICLHATNGRIKKAWTVRPAGNRDLQLFYLKISLNWQFIWH